MNNVSSSTAATHDPQAGRSRVSRTTWVWSVPGASRPAVHAAAWREAATQAAVMAVVGAVLHLGFHRAIFAYVIWGLAVVVLALGAWWPAGYRPVREGGRWLGRVVGSLLTYALLVPFFGLVIVPGSLLLRWQGRDPLHRKWRDPRHTYWIARRTKPRDENIRRQFLREDRQARTALREVAVPQKPDSRDGSP